MRALVFKEPWKLVVEERPEPESDTNEALLRILATGICGSDLHGYTGETGRRSPGQVMGHETVAEVLEDRTGQHAPGAVVTVNPLIGCDQCHACATGNRQQCATRKVIGVDPALSSAFAERMTAPADRLVALPAGTPPRLGALIEPLAVGYHAVQRAHATPDDAVLVVGAGPIGQAAALAARRIGSTDIVVSELNPGRRRLVEDLGFTTVDASTSGPSEITAALGRPASVVIDAVGASATIEAALEAAALGGRIVLLGLAAPRVELPAYSITTAERDLLGSFGYDDTAFSDTAVWIGGREDELAPLINHEVDLDGAPEAFRALATGDLQASKVLVFCS